jgi:hypothetical protein
MNIGRLRSFVSEWHTPREPAVVLNHCVCAIDVHQSCDTAYTNGYGDHAGDETLLSEDRLATESESRNENYDEKPRLESRMV